MIKDISNIPVISSLLKMIFTKATYNYYSISNQSITRLTQNTQTPAFFLLLVAMRHVNIIQANWLI